MKRFAFLSILILILITNTLLAQEHKRGDVIIGFCLGTSFSNLLNSSAPHKINIFGSDVNPAIFPSSDLTKSTAYTDYKTGILKDILYSLSSGIQLEYFMKDNLSVSSGIDYEPKGIDLNYSNTIGNYTIAGVTMVEKYRFKINNDYLTIPVLMKKYILKKKNVFISGGVYVGYLMSSKIDYLNQKTISYESEMPIDNSIGMNGEGNKQVFKSVIDKKDSKREYTNKIDFGFSVGAGYVKSISKKLLFKSDLLFNVGLKKVDSKYNNDFSITSIPSTTGIVSVVRSTNYYGLNSNSKNINMLLTVGLGYKIAK